MGCSTMGGDAEATLPPRGPWTKLAAKESRTRQVITAREARMRGSHSVRAAGGRRCRGRSRTQFFLERRRAGETERVIGTTTWKEARKIASYSAKSLWFLSVTASCRKVAVTALRSS